MWLPLLFIDICPPPEVIAANNSRDSPAAHSLQINHVVIQQGCGLDELDGAIKWEFPRHERRRREFGFPRGPQPLGALRARWEIRFVGCRRRWRRAVKVDKGPEPEKDVVQLMRPNAGPLTISISLRTGSDGSSTRWSANILPRTLLVMMPFSVAGRST